MVRDSHGRTLLHMPAGVGGGNVIKRLAMIAVLIVLLVLPFPSDLGAERSGPAGEAPYVAGEVLVKPKRVAPGIAVAAARRAASATEHGQLRSLRVQRWRVPVGREQQMVERLSRHSAIEWAQLNYIYQVSSAPAPYPIAPQAVWPNDTHVSQQWSLLRIGAFDAWSTTSGNPSVIVAVIDTGFDFSHPDRPVNLVDGYDFVPEEGDNHPEDEHGHGTHVTGIIAAATDNGIGVAGVAPGVSIMVLRVLDANGLGSEFKVAQAIEYAVDHGARVVNMSLGGIIDAPAMREACSYAYSRGVLLVAAAGNGGEYSRPYYPAAYPTVLAVAALGSDDAVASFSSQGDYVTIAAPGAGILSTIRGSAYGTMSGTSMATPHVSAVAGLIWSAHPSLSVPDVRTILIGTAHDVEAYGWDRATGWGRVDAHASARLAEQGLHYLFLPSVRVSGN